MKHVHKAVPFGNNMNMSIRLEVHKTALSGTFAYLHMSKKVYDMLLGYCKVVIKDQRDGDQYVFGEGDPYARNNAVNRWLQKAWANKAAPMAAYMKNRESTADRLYAVHEQLKQSEKMYLFVDQVQSKKNRSPAFPSAAAAPLVPEYYSNIF
ncbi:hypothetical protein DPMN_090945 [Dreissena polymorpha]|uniref:Uncharacterized protein n=1 Tax=Dreissena polymorpha TaxID=45954 RepID=A0A9D4QZI6_DREPO|nr:hypothetical protein DPMN_090945 [Dreissena polymorpha]